MKPSTVNLKLNFDHTTSTDLKNLQQQSANTNNFYYDQSNAQTPNYGYDPFISAQMQMIELYTPDATESEKTFCDASSEKSTKSNKNSKADCLSLSSIIGTDHKKATDSKDIKHSNQNSKKHESKQGFYLHEQKKPKVDEMQHSGYEEDFYIDPVLINDRDGFSTAASDNSSDDTFETYESMMENLDDFEVNDNYSFQNKAEHNIDKLFRNQNNNADKIHQRSSTKSAGKENCSNNLPNLRAKQKEPTISRKENGYSKTMDEFLEAELLAESFCADEPPIIRTKRQDSISNGQENGLVKSMEVSAEADGLLANFGISRSTDSSPRLNRSKRIDLEKFDLTEILDGNLATSKHNQDDLFGSSSPISGSKKSLDRKRLSKKTRHEMLFASCDIETAKSIFPQEEYQVFSASFDADSGFSTDRDVKQSHVDFLRNSPSPQRLKNISENFYSRLSPTKNFDDFEKLSRTSSPSYNLTSSLRNTPSPERIRNITIDFSSGRSSPTKNPVANKKSRNGSPVYNKSDRNTPSPHKSNHSGRSSPNKKNSSTKNASKKNSESVSGRSSPIKNCYNNATALLPNDIVVNSSNDSESEKTLDDEINYINNDITPYSYSPSPCLLNDLPFNDFDPMSCDYNPMSRNDSDSSAASRHRGQKLGTSKHHQQKRELSHDKVRLK